MSRRTTTAKKTEAAATPAAAGATRGRPSRRRSNDLAKAVSRSWATRSDTPPASEPCSRPFIGDTPRNSRRMKCSTSVAP